MFTTTANTVCRCHDQFAAGRAAVKPACRFRQARGLRRRSEYGSSVQSHHPAGIQNSGGVMFLFNPAGSVSELKLLGIQCEDRPAFFAGRSFLIPSSRDTSFLPTQTSIPIPRPLLPVDRFPSFIVIASPSVITTTLTLLGGLSVELKGDFSETKGALGNAYLKTAVEPSPLSVKPAQ